MKSLDLHNWIVSDRLIIPTYVKDPLTESDILNLQDHFLTNGFHYIRVKNLESGRELIKKFLSTIPFYHEIACLSHEKKELDPGISNMMDELTLGNYLKAPYDFEEFFIEEFYFDFMWIEATKSLLASKWYGDFEHQLIDLHIDKNIPIFVLTYEKECKKYL